MNIPNTHVIWLHLKLKMVLVMRVKNIADIEKLGKHAQAQLIKHLGEPVNPTQSVEEVKISSQRSKPARIQKLEDGRNYCPIPPSDPAVWLYQSLEREFGSWWEGGELVCEMILPGHAIKFRFDYALVRSKIAIEFDGYGFHKSKDAFNRDRAKTRFALLNGWVVFSVTNKDVRENLTELVDSLTKLNSIRANIANECYDIVQVGNTQSKYIELPDRT